jgi:alpha-beta hydrolase superfamily lysophospholipase
MTSLRRIRSLDGVSIAVHELSKAPPTAKRVLFSHATGFHGSMFNKTMQTLSPHFNCMSIDHRGHGLTRYDPVMDNNGKDGNTNDNWEMFGSDLLAVSADFTKDSDQGDNSVIGIYFCDCTINLSLTMQ